MAHSPLPHALAMRELKYGAEATSAEKDRVAAALVAQDRQTQALLLYDGRSQDVGARRLLEEAVTHGAAFRVLSLRRMGLEVSAADLRACAQAAERAGHWLEARSCWLALDDPQALQRLAEHLPPSLRPPPPVPPTAPPATTTSH